MATREGRDLARQVPGSRWGGESRLGRERRSPRRPYWPFKGLRPARPQGAPIGPESGRAQPNLTHPPAAFPVHLPRGPAAAPANRRPARQPSSAWPRPRESLHPIGRLAEAALACRGRGERQGRARGGWLERRSSREVRESFFGGGAGSGHVPRLQAARRGRRVSATPLPQPTRVCSPAPALPVGARRPSPLAPRPSPPGLDSPHCRAGPPRTPPAPRPGSSRGSLPPPTPVLPSRPADSDPRRALLPGPGPQAPLCQLRGRDGREGGGDPGVPWLQAGGRQGSGTARGLRGGRQAGARRGPPGRREGVPRGGAREEARLAQGQEAEEDPAKWAQGTGHRLRALPERAARADSHAPPGSALSRDHQDAGCRVEQAAAGGEAAVPG
uniref:High mobility group 20B n=1 Tax=Canis lupus familiaris TaxID=9615 RepID=A0A8C0MJN2_CANLF